ncbi:hypothetical protein [Paenibacillus antarcticus]|uniref:DUF4878 domain-containing protein n=1 Tax=Paenibacillus antarcticus TaxID=253703 RepID=A0A168PXG7_9BACL|nr:hypothetical protein [Paenibacillus antarcticus]OAB47164.1 hypothetical protein PBAT_07755 [Paenibacillus antarcticus]
MKFKLLVMIIVIINLIGCSESKTLDTKEKVREQVTAYLKAVEIKDIDTMVKYADDLRFPDKIQQKSEYQTISQKIDKALIKDLRKINDTEYSVTITTEENGKMDEFTFPIKYVDQDWRIIVGQERNNTGK